VNAVPAPQQDAGAPWANLGAAPQHERLRAALQRGLTGFEAGVHVIDAVRVSKIHRSSSLRRDPHPISMCLDLDVREVASGKRSEQCFYAKAYRGGASAAAFAAIDQGGMVPPKVGAALAHVAVLDMLMWAWPNDPSLPQLAVLLDVSHRVQHLPEAVRALGKTIRAVEVLRYQPERRATLRYTLADAALTPRWSSGASASLWPGFIWRRCPRVRFDPPSIGSASCAAGFAKSAARFPIWVTVRKPSRPRWRPWRYVCRASARA
jgi:hypothetical protein